MRYLALLGTHVASGSIQFTPSDGLGWHGPHPGITEGFDVCGALAA
jgi:hypothetical protein